MAVDDKYVMNGVWLTCDKGVTPSRFNVTPKPVQLYDEHFANELDKIALVNILPFGACSVKYGSPCVPLPLVWNNVMDEGLTVLGARPLLDTSKCQCGVGGQISIHFTRAGASAAAQSNQLDHVDEAADKLESASTWAFWGGIGLAVGGAILCATGVGAPLGAAMIVGAEVAIEASTVMASAGAVLKGVTKFARNPTLENGLSIVGETLVDLAEQYVLNKLGGAVVKRLGKWGTQVSKKLNLSERAKSIAHRIRCFFTGHPVDVISGYLYTETVDFEFAGPLPLRWERLWYSTSVHTGALGHGWHHAYDLALVVVEAEGLAGLRGADGRGIAFDVPALGEKSFNRLEKMSLLRDERGYGVLDHEQGLTYRFGSANADGVRVLATVENANGFAITFTYDGQGHLAQVVDSARRAFAVQCDEAGRILTISTAHPTEPRQRVTLVSYAYNSRGELVRAADALEQTATYQYQDKLLVQETFKNGLSFYFEYVGQGPEARCVHTWGDEGIYDHQLVYDLEARRTVVTNSLGYATTYIGNENGLVVEVQDARGGVTRTDYNEFQEKLRETDPLGATTTYAYDERGNRRQVSTADGTTLTMDYSSQDQPLRLTDTAGNSVTWQHDEQDNPIAYTDEAGLVTTYTYEQGLLRHIRPPAGPTVALAYDAAFNLTSLLLATGQASATLFDSWGRVRKATDLRNNVRWLEHDLVGQLITSYEPDGNVRRRQYDAAGNLLRLRDRQQDVHYAYRGISRLIRCVEAGTAIEFLYDTEEQLRAVLNEHGLTYRFSLDAKGSVLTETGFDGRTHRYVRDIGGRITERIKPGGHTSRYTYTVGGQVAQVQYGDGSSEYYRYTLDGRLQEAENEETTVIFTRDSLGRVLCEAQGEHTVQSTYTPFGQRSRVSSSLGADISLHYDAFGAVSQMQAGTWQALFERDAQGLEVQRTLSGGLRTQWQYDQVGRPIEQQVLTSRRYTMRQRHYTWQTNNRLSQVQDSLTGLAQFEHDAVGNLAATTYGDGQQQLRWPDAVGNLFHTATQQDRRYGQGGELLEAAGTHYTYDAEGNLASKRLVNGQQWHYSWNAAGHLAEVLPPDGQRVQFAYDGLGRRVSKHTAQGTWRWVWDGNTPLHEWLEPTEAGATSEHQVTTWIFEANSAVPAARLAGGTYQNVVADHLGTPLELHGSRGELVWAAELDSYGAVRQQQGEGQACPFRYQGQYEDVETGLYYNRFRYYDPHAGQYISQDPIGVAGSFAAYGYVTDPLIYTDVLGLSQAYYLEKALNAAGRPLQPGQTAHHIVQLTNPSTYAAQSRALLARHGLNPDVAANGARLWGTHPNQVALPTHPGVIAARATGNYHAGPHIHSPVNDKRVFRALEHAENNGSSITATLEDIGRQMESGTWKAGHSSCVP